jgi:hypothetical protein
MSIARQDQGIRRNEGERSPFVIAQREMRPGEKLVWAERPRPGALAHAGLTTALFGIPFLAFALFWTFMASGATASGGIGVVFPMFGLPFIGVGLWLVGTPLWAAQRAQSTIYAITDQRLVIMRTGATSEVQSYGPEDFDSLDRRERPDGSGDIVFRNENLIRRGRNATYVTNNKIGFFGVPNVR